MANGVLGKSMSTAGSEVTVYTVPATVDFSTVSINLTNLGVADDTVKVAVSTGATASPADYLEYNAIVPGNGGVLERTCVVCSGGENVLIEATSANIAVRVYGLEKLL